MDEPARKRRKTSSPLERASSPLRKPPRRPSFASPTKASLARNYPNLLPARPTSSGSPSRPNSRGEALARGKQTRAPVQSEDDIPGALGQATLEEDSTGGAQQGGNNSGTITPRSKRRIGGQRSGSIPSDAAGEEETDLPTTPSQRGLEEQDGPRRGVLFSSPSKRPLRVKNPVKQSPLRPKAPAVQQVSHIQPLDNDTSDEPVLENKVETKEPPDPEVEQKRQEKKRLQHELAELEAQVSKCAEEIANEQRRGPKDVLLPPDRTSMTELLNSISGPDHKKQEKVPVSNLLCSFLPFSTIAIRPPQRGQQTKKMPSHHPVELSDPLPYLEMFTSLKISTRLKLPSGKISLMKNRVNQEHIIDIHGPQKLLTAQISTVIDAIKSEAIDMQIVRLSSWAERELGTYLRMKAKEQDLGNACWAIDSYWNIASKRALYWHRCETTFAHLLARGTAEDTENLRPQGKQDAKISRQDLNRHLHRETLVLQDKHVLLKLNWRITFDWAGEAESDVTIEPAFPSVWTEGRDAAKTFKKVPETFSSLLQSRGVFEATRVMTTLLFAH